MKRKSLIIGLLIAVFSAWLMPDASAQRRGYHPRHGHHSRGYYHRGYHPRPRMYAPPPRVVIVPQYGYRRGYYHPRSYYRRHHYYAPPPRYYHGNRYHYRGRGWR